MECHIKQFCAEKDEVPNFDFVPDDLEIEQVIVNVDSAGNSTPQVKELRDCELEGIHWVSNNRYVMAEVFVNE